jgi:4-diphosphocytidyl-2C-methyl-D-erythritol kinase
VHTLTLKSYAKLNLYLKVLNKRKDGYHNLLTLFERIDLFDTITFKKLNPKIIRIVSSSREIPRYSGNLAYRAASLLQDTFNLDCGVEIKITKRIPVGSGMGGGSGNAAYTLLGLNKLWNLKLSRKRLAELARKIGSDAPFFIYDVPFALGQGRGDRIQVLKALSGVRLWHILVVPKIPVSTPLIYHAWDDFVAKNKSRVWLTSTESDVKILCSCLKGDNDLFRIGESLYNSLEVQTARLYPELIRIKDKLKALSLKSILMSGSGPAIFSIASSRKEAASAYQYLRKNRFWRCFVVKTK